MDGPRRAETTVYRSADPPGDEGWPYFHDNIWHVECYNPGHMQEVAERAPEACVSAPSFSEFRRTGDYLDDIREAIAEDSDRFNADTVDAVLSNYLGSSLRVVDGD